MLITSVEVERRPLGYTTFPRCVAELDRDSQLTIRSIDNAAVIQRYARDDWRTANVADEHGAIVDRFTSRIPEPTGGSLFETAVLLAKVHGSQS